MKRIALVLAFAFLLLGISSCKAGIAYDASTNTITLIGDEEKGGSASNPFTFADVYYADKNGTLTLFSDYVTSGNTYTLTTQVRPTDEEALKVNFSISSLSGSGNITVRGKDKDGEYQEEVIEITSTGTYTTENWYSEITNFTVNGFSADLEVVQGQWGVVWRNENFFRFDAILKIGDDATPTYFKDVRKIIYFSSALYKESKDNTLMNIRTKTTVTFGDIYKEESKSTHIGCIFLSPETGNGWGTLVARGNTSFLSCYFGGKKEFYIQLMDNSKVWNSYIEQSLSMRQETEIYHIYSFGQFGGIAGASQDIKIEEVWRHAGDVGVWLSNPATVRNLQVKLLGRKTHVYVKESGDATSKLIDCDMYDENGELTDEWIFYFYGSAEGQHKVKRQYTLNLRVVDEMGNPIKGANIRIYNKTGALVANLETDGNGSITTILTYGTYAKNLSHSQQNRDVLNANLTLETPHTLVISKDGFKEYRVTFKANKKLDWKIALKREESDVIVETKERKERSMEEGLVLGFGFAIVFFGLAIFFLKGGEIK
ncbi:MAG: hypothetical protein DRP08_05110 [Candidatus Aenigmatarchaeota archaeon]|nr:MAG: hypothetical protein DRP08_05110 [Candidatus Aenigmarchaeota archaeon]